MLVKSKNETMTSRWLRSCDAATAFAEDGTLIPENVEAARRMALAATSYHWALHPWAIYAVVALARDRAPEHAPLGDIAALPLPTEDAAVGEGLGELGESLLPLL